MDLPSLRRPNSSSHPLRGGCLTYWVRRASHNRARLSYNKYMKFLWCAALAATTLSAQTFSGGPALDQVINQAIEQGKMPGAVLLVGHDGKVVYRKAYGKRALVPQLEAMTVDTVSDCASRTNVIAPTASLMKLFDEG